MKKHPQAALKHLLFKGLYWADTPNLKKFLKLVIENPDEVKKIYEQIITYDLKRKKREREREREREKIRIEWENSDVRKARKAELEEQDRQWAERKWAKLDGNINGKAKNTSKLNELGRLSTQAQAVYMVLITHMNCDGICRLTASDISERIGNERSSKGNIHKYIREIMDAGYLLRYKGPGNCTTYRIPSEKDRQIVINRPETSLN